MSPPHQSLSERATPSPFLQILSKKFFFIRKRNFTMKSMKGRRRNTFSERTGTNLPRKTRCMRIRKPADLSSESCPSRGLIRSGLSCGATSVVCPVLFERKYAVPSPLRSGCCRSAPILSKNPFVSSFPFSYAHICKIAQNAVTADPAYRG